MYPCQLFFENDARSGALRDGHIDTAESIY